MASSDSAAEVGSGEHSVQRDGEGWLGSGSGVGQLNSFSVRPMVNGNPQFTSTHSTNVAKLTRGPSPNSLAFVTLPGSCLVSASGIKDIKFPSYGLQQSDALDPGSGG